MITYMTVGVQRNHAQMKEGVCRKKGWRVHV